MGAEVASFTPAVTVDTLAEHVPELQAALDRLHNTPCFTAEVKNITVMGLLTTSVIQWQTKLMGLHNKADSKALLDSLDGVDKAAFTSYCTPESSAWLDAGPGENGGAMSNQDFDPSYILRLGAPLFKPTDKCRDCNQLIGIHGEHAFSCRQLQPARTNRHTTVQDAFTVVARVLGNHQIRLYKNKSMNEWYTHTQTGLTAGGTHKDRPADFRMDIGVEDANEGPAARYIIDFTITHVKETHLTTRAAAVEKEKMKDDKYLTNYNIPQADKYLVPWAMETTGAWGPRAHKFAHQMAVWHQQYGGGSTVEIMAFTRRLRERIAVAVQSANAAAIRLLRVRLARGGAAPPQ